MDHEEDPVLQGVPQDVLQIIEDFFGNEVVQTFFDIISFLWENYQSIEPIIHYLLILL